MMYAERLSDEKQFLFDGLLDQDVSLEDANL